MHLGVPRHAVGFGDLLLLAKAELGDRHRRGRAQVVRVQHLKERLDNLRELVIELFVHPRREERERLDQALGMRVLTVVALDQ
ncbi:hypothetical protein D3C78_1584580 [compost metagenome]